LRIGENLLGDDHLLDLDAQAARKQVALAPALRACRPCPGRRVPSASRARRGRLELSQDLLPEVELLLVRVVALRLAPEEALLQGGDGLVLAGDLALGGGEFGIKLIDPTE